LKRGVKVCKMSWINSFTVALVKKDIARVLQLLNSIDELESIEDKQKGSALITQAITLFEGERDTTRQKMAQMQKSKKFLQSSHMEQATRFNKRY